MNTQYKFLLLCARVVRYLKLPKIIKYALFLLMRKKDIYTDTKLDISGSTIHVNLGEFIEYWIFMDGSYEGEWIKKIKKYTLKKVVIDVGANIGVYPLSLHNTASEVYAFEPELKNFHKLQENLEMNNIKNVHVIQKAVYSKSRKKMKLNISKKDHGWHSLHLDYGDKLSQEVITISIDDFVKANRIKNIGLIKIDVEGAELNVLKGATKTISSMHPAILIEINRPRLNLSGFDPIEIFNLLSKYKYVAYKMENNELHKVRNRDMRNIYNENVLFVK